VAILKSCTRLNNVKGEMNALSKILKRSNLGLPLLGAFRGIHTTRIRLNEDKKQNNDDDEKDRMLSALKTAVGFFLVPVLLILVFSGGGGGGNQMQPVSRGDETLPGSSRMGGNEQGFIEMQWHDFYNNLLLKGEVREIVVHSGLNRASAILYPGAVYRGNRLNVSRVRVSVENESQLEDKVREGETSMGITPGQGISITYDRKSEMTAQMLLIPLFLGIAFLAARGLGAIGKNFSNTASRNPFSGMSKADFTLIDPAMKKGKGTKFSDVAGLKQPKIEVLEFVDCLKNPEKYRELGAKPPKGAILFGPPGCGKTMLAKAVANEANVPFLSMNGSEFIEMIGGLGASRVRSLFKEARSRAPSIIYIDEIDAIGKQRNQGKGGPMDGGEADQTLNQLLVEMDGMGSTSNVILLASTNRSDVLDKALLRPGRFDRHITIDLPTLIERKEILESHLSRVVLDDSVSAHSNRLSSLTPGFSGADLANLVNEAALHAATNLKDKITVKDLEYAVERVTAGPEKKTSVISPQEKRVVAYHESGHALVGWLLKHTDALLKVTIIPRTSAALGFAQYTPQDKKLFSPEELLDRMMMALGGRVAESITFNRVTTGAQNDLEKVTKMAYSQIRDFGFNDTVGLVSFEQQQGIKPYSKTLANTIDLEARKLIGEAYRKTEELLKDNQDKLEILAEKLLEKETLNYDDVEALLGPPPFGSKHLVSPLDYEQSINQDAKLGEPSS